MTSGLKEKIALAQICVVFFFVLFMIAARGRAH